MRQYAALLSGLLAFLLVFVGGVALGIGVLFAVVFGGLAGGGVGMITRGVTGREAPPETYEVTAAKAVRELKTKVNQITELGTQIENEQYKVMVEKACGRVITVIDYIWTNDHGSVGSAATQWLTYADTVRRVLDRYVKIQSDPEASSLPEFRSIENGFIDFAAKAKNQSSSTLVGDIVQLQADLELMKQIPPRSS